MDGKFFLFYLWSYFFSSFLLFLSGRLLSIRSIISLCNLCLSPPYSSILLSFFLCSRLDCITLATKSRRTLHIVADRWERESGAHFERKITFGDDADLAKIKAQ